MNIIEEKLSPCPHCDRVTVHQRNRDQPTWLAHVAFALFAALLGAISLLLSGIVGVMWLVYTLISLSSTGSGSSPWMCSGCQTVVKK
jgi:hypothetical protein